jgi:hypothetical protein
MGDLVGVQATLNLQTVEVPVDTNGPELVRWIREHAR